MFLDIPSDLPPMQEAVSTMHQKQAINPGIKTYQMFEELNTGVLSSYNPATKTLTHSGIDYKVLEGSNDSLSKFPIVCMGSDPTGREIIALNPYDSPLLLAKYRELVSLLRSQPLSAEDILEFVSTYVREKIFIPDLCTENTLNILIHRWSQSNQRTNSDFAKTQDSYFVPVIPIDVFIARQVGICRHQALVTGYLLDKLVKENDLLPPGKVYYVRDIVSIDRMIGGHAWNLYIPDDVSAIWHVDALWGVIKNTKDSQDLTFLHEAYGPSAINRELTRFLEP